MESGNDASIPFRPPVVLLDANILFPVPLCDLFMHLAIISIVRVHWSARIEDEWVRNVIEKRSHLDPARILHRAVRMNLALPDAMVSGFEVLEEQLLNTTPSLPDWDDVHVLAAAIHCQATAIITKNLKDFPSERLAPFEVEALHPDVFVNHLLEINPFGVIQAVANQQASLHRPPQTMTQVLQTLQDHGLGQSSNRLRELLGPT
jgi:PIN domain